MTNSRGVRIDLQRGSPIPTLVSACWECPSFVCPVVVFDGNDRTCPGCGTLGDPVDDWAAQEDDKHMQEVMEHHGINLCLDEVAGRADNLIREFDEIPKARIIEELTAIVNASERARPGEPGDSNVAPGQVVA